MDANKIKQILKYGALSLFVGYGIARSHDLIFGIHFSVNGINDGMVTTEPVLTFSGEADHVTGMAVNGRVVPVAQDGTWMDTVALSPGYNVVTISAQDKFNRTVIHTYRLNYKQPNA